MKEKKVAILSEEEFKELNELTKMRGEVELLIAQAYSANAAFWQRVKGSHHLPRGNHYISGRSIYIMASGNKSFSNPK